MTARTLEQDPAIYLRQQPAPDSPCHILVEQIDSHDGAPAPMHMLAKVAVRVFWQAVWQTRRDKWEKFAKRAAGALAGLALANILTVLGSWLHAHDARITAEADARAAAAAEIEYRRSINDRLDRMEKAANDRMDRMEQDIRDLRRDLRRFVDKEPHPGVGVVAVGAP